MWPQEVGQTCTTKQEGEVKNKTDDSSHSHSHPHPLGTSQSHFVEPESADDDMAAAMRLVTEQLGAKPLTEAGGDAA